MNFPDFPGNIPMYQFADGTPLPAEWESKLPIRWVLDPEHRSAEHSTFAHAPLTTKPDHCAVCIEYARTYASKGAMSRTLDGAFPGYFPGTRLPISTINPEPRPRACGDKCQCWLEVLLEGEWRRIRHI